MYDYLNSYSRKEMSPTPALAQEWDTSDDGLTWTFHMRDDVTGSDGEPLTATDVAYTYNRVLDGGPEALASRLGEWTTHLTALSALLGAAATSDLVRADLVVTGDTADFCRARGIDLAGLSRRSDAR